MWVNRSFVSNYMLSMYTLYVILIGLHSLMSVCDKSQDDSLVLLDGRVYCQHSIWRNQPYRKHMAKLWIIRTVDKIPYPGGSNRHFRGFLQNSRTHCEVLGTASLGYCNASETIKSRLFWWTTSRCARKFKTVKTTNVKHTSFIKSDGYMFRPQTVIIRPHNNLS
jgi:hypothetical protein